ncbi:MAG: hypothetical protein KKC37_10245 [Proteobacteria bacterium]|nr:hypothetical protein [Pseudomonadota bacterium]
MRLRRWMLLGLAGLVLVAGWSCEPLSMKAPTSMPFIKKIAVLPFYWISPPAGARIVTNPLTGAVFAPGPYRVEAAAQLTEDWFRMLLKDRSGFAYVSPLASGRMLDGLRRTDLRDLRRRTLTRVGRSLGADAVVVGFVYRWRERVGSAVGVEQPAAVAFDALLIKTSTGAILWAGRFERTQRSLSENLLEIGLYASQGVRWLTARELAAYGLSRMLSGFPTSKSK